MTGETIEIRPAEPADAELLADLCATTFRDTHLADNDPGEVERHVALHFSPQRIAEELADGSFVTLLAWERGRPIGYVTLHAGLPPACIHGSAPIELSRIYVVRDRIGRGHGSTLMGVALAEGRRRGGETMWVGLWEENVRARDFYEKWGFERVGTYEFELGGTPYEDLVMARPIRAHA